MKNQKFNPSLLNSLICIVTGMFFLSCSSPKWILPREYSGQWETDKERITVRYKLDEKQRHSQFKSDSATISITINNDKTVSGFIGSTAFEHGKILKNYTLWDTGVSFVIECGPIGKIFPDDPVEMKEVEVWLDSPDENGRIKASLRLGGSVFPMADIVFEKVKE
ncbi:MAG: hypothetical protein JXA23_08225 [Bacteroidales bacterium]|nr:hypothetical protein [Bacteroidales bacterium]